MSYVSSSGDYCFFAIICSKL